MSPSQLVQGATHQDEAGLRPVPAALEVRDLPGLR